MLCRRYGRYHRVWLEGKNLKLPYQSLKLAPKCHGPFCIKCMISNVAAQLELPPAWTIHDIFHTGLLMLFRETPQYSDNFPRPPPDVIDGEEEFEVEAIINHRYFGKRRNLQYLVKWKGYPSAENSWERHQDMLAPQLIQEYHRCHPLQDKRRGSQRRVIIRSLHSWPITPLPLPSSSMNPPTSPLLKHPSPEHNELPPPPLMSTVTLSSPPMLSIPPRYGDPFLDNLFDPDLPVSPTSGYTQLEHLGDCLATEPRAVLAQKVAKAALRQAHEARAESEQRQAALNATAAKEALTCKMWREEVASLQQQLANIQASNDPPTLAGLL